MYTSPRERVLAALKEINDEVLNRNVMDYSEREIFRRDVVKAIRKTGRLQYYIAGVVGTTESTISRMQYPSYRKKAYEFQLAVNLSLLAADNFEDFIRLMILSGNTPSKDLGKTERLVIEAARLIYDNNFGNWEERIYMMYDVYEMVPRMIPMIRN